MNYIYIQGMPSGPATHTAPYLNSIIVENHANRERELLEKVDKYLYFVLGRFDGRARVEEVIPHLRSLGKAPWC